MSLWIRDSTRYYTCMFHFHKIHYSYSSDHFIHKDMNKVYGYVHWFVYKVSWFSGWDAWSSKGKLFSFSFPHPAQLVQLIWTWQLPFDKMPLTFKSTTSLMSLLLSFPTMWTATKGLNGSFLPIQRKWPGHSFQYAQWYTIHYIVMRQDSVCDPPKVDNYVNNLALIIEH